MHEDPEVRTLDPPARAQELEDMLLGSVSRVACAGDGAFSDSLRCLEDALGAYERFRRGSAEALGWPPDFEARLARCWTEIRILRTGGRRAVRRDSIGVIRLLLRALRPTGPEARAQD